MKQTRQYGELVFLSVIFLYVIYYFLTIHSYARQATLWPFVLMGGTVLCIINVVIQIYKENKEREHQTFCLNLSALKAKGPIFFIVLSFTLYTLLLKKLGLHCSNFMLCFFIVFYLNKRKWKIAAAVAVITTLCFYLVFDLALGIRFPKFNLF